ncbi:hypothetical protein CO053_03985 [Candidatus Shapirobacteria bacterium CG_4_9_14_0_2_um_filter_40_11]|uniref:Peptidase C51 domain-containing protein n=1 Tax=Candidatus Shapirobacteria bacterium CG_4_9_14_0_2_um_filter_40_11 TaxID=1974876 RepID=A0A2M8ETV6_9BACT|nr:MAG: hypothetical protein CO053_03985 [Candidatus Shapirobacteria bacterium CG_4_9_14_0_2_um_filter_40_11]
MAPQTVFNKTEKKIGSLEYFLKIASFFEVEQNRKQKKDDWTFKQIDRLLRNWAVKFDPQLQKASFEEILIFIKSLAAEEITQTTIPTPLLEGLQENLAKENKQKAEIRLKAIEEAQKEIIERYKIRLKKQLVERLTQSPIPKEDTVKIAGGLLAQVQNRFPQTDLSLLIEKWKKIPPEEVEHRQVQDQIEQKFSQIWKSAVDQVAEQDRLSAKQKDFLKSLSFPALQVLKPAETLAEIGQYQEQINEISYFQTKIKALQQQQVENLVKLLSPALDPQKADLFSKEFIKLFPDNLVQYSSILSAPQEIEEAALATLLQMVGSEVSLKPEEVAAVSNSLISTGTSEITAYKKLSLLPKSDINPLRLKDEDGVTVLDRIKKQLLSGGINVNPENDSQLITFRYQIQAVEAIYKGLKKQDLEVKINQLLETGVPEHSREITELRGVAAIYMKVLQKTEESGFSKRQIEKWQKKASFPIRIPIFSKIKSWFLNTSLGKPIKLALEKSAQKSLQALWTAGREGIKKIAVPLITKVLTALGLGAKAALVGATNVVGLALLVVPKLIGKVKDFFKGIFSSGTRIFGSILSGIMGTTDIPEDSDSKWLKWIFIGIFAFIFFFVGVLDKGVKSGALINEEAELSEPGFTSPGLPSQCQPSRHFAEEVICVLEKCNIKKITSSSVNSTEQCIKKSNLTGKTALISNLTALYKGKLQCIGFVDAIQEALGKGMGPRKNACQYYISPPIGYNLIEGTISPQVGDVAVWNEAGCGGDPKSTAAYWGHIAVVIEINGNRKLTVAEVNGINGILRIVEYSYGHPENSTDPTGFLRQ